MIQRTGGTAGGPALTIGWEVELPVLDPAALLLVTVFLQPRKGLYGRLDGNSRPGVLIKNPAVPLGKLRLRLSRLRPEETLSADLPLLSDRLKGAKRVATLGVTLQMAFVDPKTMVQCYLTPALPKAAYYLGTDGSAHQKVMARETRRIVQRWLLGTNPAITAEQAQALLDTNREKFAMSRLKVNWRRIQMILAGLRRFGRWFDRVCKRWEDPQESTLVVVAVVALCFWPRYVLPGLLGWLVYATYNSDHETAGLPIAMEQDPPGLEDDNVELETKASNPVAVLRQKVETLQRVALVVQNVFDDLASGLERLQAILTWQDPTATTLILGVLSAIAALFLVLGGAPVMAFALFWIVRPPRLRTPTPAAPAVIFGRLPSRADRVM